MSWKRKLALASSVTLLTGSSLMARAEDVNKTPLNSNITPHGVASVQKKDLHENLRKDTAVQGTTAKDIEEAERVARAVNQLPGEKVDPRDLEHPPIKGFHPIRKLLRPLDNLEDSANKLHKEASKLEKPMGDLQAPMVDLQKKMVNVDSGVGHMQRKLDNVSDQVTGARADLSEVREEINRVKSPIQALQKPVTDIARPLEEIQTKLNVLLLFILVFMLIVSFGTPIVAIVVYRNRSKILGTRKPLPRTS